MPEQNHSTEIGDPLQHPSFEQQQRRRMLIALGVLLLALISVLIKDRQFWFPPSPSAESETPEQSVTPIQPITTSAKTAKPAAPPKPIIRAKPHARPKGKRPAPITPATETQDSMSPVITATNRAVLPPLDIEVVAGNQHRAVSPGDGSVKLDMQPSAAEALPQTTAPPEFRDNDPAAPHTAARVQLSTGSAQVVSRVDPSYPLLAKQMKVQGAVVLEALISKAGSIQEIQVLSGPAILSEAARQAVKQWHFKPYYQSGQPVETEARITVNFTISTD